MSEELFTVMALGWGASMVALGMVLVGERQDRVDSIIGWAALAGGVVLAGTGVFR